MYLMKKISYKDFSKLLDRNVDFYFLIDLLKSMNIQYIVNIYYYYDDIEDDYADLIDLNWNKNMTILVRSADSILVNYEALFINSKLNILIPIIQRVFDLKLLM